MIGMTLAVCSAAFAAAACDATAAVSALPVFTAVDVAELVPTGLARRQSSLCPARYGSGFLFCHQRQNTDRQPVRLSDLLTSEVHLLLNSSARISEATAQLARDAAQCINERTQQAQRRL